MSRVVFNAHKSDAKTGRVSVGANVWDGGTRDCRLVVSVPSVHGSREVLWRTVSGPCVGDDAAFNARSMAMALLSEFEYLYRREAAFARAVALAEDVMAQVVGWESDER